MGKTSRKNLITVCLFLFAAVSAFGQSIDLKLDDVTVEKAIDAVHRIGDYSIVLNSSDVDLNKVISVNASQASIQDVMNQILAGQNLTCSIKGKNIKVKKKNRQRRLCLLTGILTDR